jgi:nickel-dependent lactate racemase
VIVLELQLKYGAGYIKGILPEANIAGILKPRPGNPPADPADAVRQALANPLGAPPLENLVRERAPRRVVVIVNDVTRPVPYRQLLPPLLSVLESSGVARENITLMVATGIHRGNTPEENQLIFGPAIASSYRIKNHDPDHDLIDLGPLGEGRRLVINREVAEADLLITTGIIIPHEIAGFSGGRKSVLPGVAGRSLIASHHSMMTRPGVGAARRRGNPAHHLMVEAARKVGVDFILNAVTDEHNQLLHVVAGDLEAAWESGVDYSRRMSIVELDAPADVVVAGAGGHPRDINAYQMAKPLRNAARAVREGGTVILAARCGEGFGEDTLVKWLDEASSPEDIIKRFARGFVLGGHKAFALARVVSKREVVLVSDLSRRQTSKLFMTYAPDLQSALEYVRHKHGDGFKALIMPFAGLVLPVPRGGSLA